MNETTSDSVMAATALCSITITVEQLRNEVGQICFSLFDGPKGFPGKGERAIAKGFTPAAQPTYTFHDLQPGRYAVAIFHDEDCNGRLNKGVLGIPKEGFGFSNNPKILMGAPSFRAAALRIERPQTAIQIRLKYFSA